MSKKRPQYDAARKRRAAEQVLLQKQPVARVARQLQCSPQSVKNWIDQFRDTIIQITRRSGPQIVSVFPDEKEIDERYRPCE